SSLVETASRMDQAQLGLGPFPVRASRRQPVKAPPSRLGPVRIFAPVQRWAVFVVVSMVLPVVSRGATVAPPWPEIPTSDWQEPARPDSGGRDALILLSRAVLEDREGEYQLEVFQRLRILTAEGRKAATIEREYLKSLGEIVAISARSIRQDRYETALDPTQIVRTTIVKSRKYEYLRVSFVIPGVEPGCIAEFRFVMRGKYKSSWYEPWYFQNEYYTCTSTLDWKVSEWAHSNGLVPSW